ncbi:hypothetical protein GCM10023147_00610 [Tsukamurella soli]|uniref:Uncharacterized protein n=1 Tax=Tsukamurella soli TaxID=644556 RepID=A0ABP8J0F2_9ACTN
MTAGVNWIPEDTDLRADRVEIIESDGRPTRVDSTGRRAMGQPTCAQTAQVRIPLHRSRSRSRTPTPIQDALIRTGDGSR